MVRNLSECFLGTMPIGETCKLANGELLVETIVGLSMADLRFYENLDMRGPS
jgi:hypothetical protein